MTGLRAAVEQADILVTTGAGGVGKTTMAAALALAAADAGRTSLVVTIDPARRLAQAMGLAELGADPVKVLDTSTGGSLEAMMLDMQSTFDGIIDQHATSADQARQIKANRIYATLSSSLSGTQEYMAMEKLHDLHGQGRWDLVVVDTPPSRSALDFLDAPARMTSFLDGRLLRLLLKPAAIAGRGYLRFVGLGASAFMKVAGKITGVEVLDDLADFFANFDGMYAGFKERAEQVLELLHTPGARFVVVASPDPAPLREARWFARRLGQEGLHLADIVVNRVHDVPDHHDPARLRHVANALVDQARNDPAEGTTPDAVDGTAAGHDEPALAAALRIMAHRIDLARHDHETITKMLGPVDHAGMTLVREADTDVHALADLRAIAQQLLK